MKCNKCKKRLRTVQIYINYLDKDDEPLVRDGKKCVNCGELYFLVRYGAGQGKLFLERVNSVWNRHKFNVVAYKDGEEI